MGQKVNSVSTGLMWKLLERFGVSGVQFVLQIVLARLLSPEHYGALSIMIIFTALANVFVQNGFNTSLVQNKDVTEEDYSSVLWVTLGIASGIYVVIFFTSPFIAEFYKMPDIVYPLRVLALILFPGALNSVQLAKVSREMDFRKVFFSNVGAVLISGLAGIVIAYAGGGLWALVAQNFLNVLVACIVMKSTVKLKLHFKCNSKRVKVLFSYGWKIMVSSLIDTLYQDIRSLVIGKKYNSVTLGYYNRGKQFPQFIITSVDSSVRSVMLPAMSARQDDKSDVKQIMRRSVVLSSYIIFPLMAGLAAVSRPLVHILLTDKWLPSVPYIQIYCASFAFYPVHSCNLQAINAVGRSDIFLKLEMIKKAVGISSLVFAVFFFRTPVAIAMTGVFTSVTSCFINAYPNKRLINYTYREQIKDLVPSMVMSLVMCAIVLLVGMVNINAYMLILLQALVGVLVYVVLSKLFGIESLGYIVNMVKGLLGRKIS